ncbi:MAG TPA: hypothetical protein VG247_25290 [Pseudonocardiaceae bacterium]|nr:hypothetical protein [Pseudonocardiaceae bacterium]
MARRSPLLASVAVAGAVLLCAGCAETVSGQPHGVAVPVESVTQVVRQAIDNITEAGALHLSGTLTTKANDQLTVDLFTTASGEVTGTATLDGQQAQLADLSGRLYVNASQAFWSAIADLPSGSDSAAAGKWVTVPTDLLGVDPVTDLTPQALGRNLGEWLDTPDNRAFASIARTQHDGASAVQINPAVPDGTRAMMVSAAAPHGIVYLKVPVSDASELSVDVSDASPNVATVYQTMSAQANVLQTAIDPNLDIQQGSQTWGTCGATSCAVNVAFTNSSSVSTKVLVIGNWTGDNNPVGTCQVITDPVAAGAGGTATCTVSTPGWAAFYHHAQTVPGSHPYELRWAAFALAEPPNQQAITAEATEAGAQPNPSGSTDSSTGGETVYRIDYQDQSGHTQVWKLGATNISSWQGYANSQAADCLAQSRTSCSVSLVGRASNLVSAEAVVAQQVKAARSATGHCPPGQWAFCG